MKKIIALALVIVMCLSFVACGNNAEKDSAGNNAETNNTQVSDKKTEAEKAIIDEWVCTDAERGEMKLLFNEDKTGMVQSVDTQSSDEFNFTWKYDEELKCYTLFIYGQLLPGTLKTVDDVEQLNFRGFTFVRSENN